MPILRITSLPFENQDSADWASAISTNFSKITEIPLKHVSVAWHLLHGGYYAYNGVGVEFQPHDSHPMIVEVMLPDFYALDRVELIIKAAVESICRVTKMPKENIFVQANRARSGAVYDDGRIIRW
jgi:hypothetical protein